MKQMAESFKGKGYLWMTSFPVTLCSITWMYSAPAHRDNDVGFSYILWLDHGPGKDSGGSFELTEYGIHVSPKSGSMFILDTNELMHRSTPLKVVQNRGRKGVGKEVETGRLGIALAVSAVGLSEVFCRVKRGFLLAL